MHLSQVQPTVEQRCTSHIHTYKCYSCTKSGRRNHQRTIRENNPSLAQDSNPQPIWLKSQFSWRRPYSFLRILWSPLNILWSVATVLSGWLSLWPTSLHCAGDSPQCVHPIRVGRQLLVLQAFVTRPAAVTTCLNSCDCIVEFLFRWSRVQLHFGVKTSHCVNIIL